MQNNLIQNDSLLSIFDVCQSLRENLDSVSIQQDPTIIRHLIALLTSKLQNHFSMVTDFTNLDSRMRYQKNTFANYVHKWRLISDIKNNSGEFIEDTHRIISLITPKRNLAV